MQPGFAVAPDCLCQEMYEVMPVCEHWTRRYVTDPHTCFQCVATLTWAASPCRNVNLARAIRNRRPQGQVGGEPSLKGGAGHAIGVGLSKGGMAIPEGALAQLSGSGCCPGACNTPKPTMVVFSMYSWHK